MGIDKDKCRIVKISKDALYEFLYETFIANHEELLDVDAIDVSDNFAIDWENGNLIFCAYKGEDENENIIPFPKDIDLQKLIKKLPDTTTTVLTNSPYKDCSFDELRKIIDE